MSQKEAHVDSRSLYRWQYGPPHRWVLARDLAEKRLKGLSLDDPWLHAAAAYLQRSGAHACLESATGRAAWIAAAVIIDQDPARSNRLKVLVLANMARQDMARLLGLEEPAIEAWELLFFDVRDCLAALDWLADRVIRPTEDGGDFETAARMRLALHGGPALAEHILIADTKFADEMKLSILKTQVGIKASRAFDIAMSTPKSAVQVLQLYVEMLMEEKKLDQAETARAADEQRRHDYDMRKLDVEHARAQEAKAKLDLETAQLTACAAAAQEPLPEIDSLIEPPAEPPSVVPTQDEQTEVEAVNETLTQSRSAAA